MPNQQINGFVKIYTMPNSTDCFQAKKFFDERGMPYIELDISKDRKALDEMVLLTRQRVVPVIVWDSTFVAGFNLPLLEQLLEFKK